MTTPAALLVAFGLSLVHDARSFHTMVEGPAPVCAALPQPTMRMRLILEADIPDRLRATLETVIAEVWRDEGIAIHWLPAAAPGYGDPLTNIWLRITSKTLDRRPTPLPTLGYVRFMNGVPHPHVLVSWQAVQDWVRAQRDRAFGAQFRGASHAGLGTAGFDEFAVRALGYAAAHEVGHVVLASRTHDRDGLMRPDIVSMVVGTNASLDVRLSPSSRAALRSRLLLGAECPRRLAAAQ